MATKYIEKKLSMSSSRSLPFLSCHLEMLKTLYQSSDVLNNDTKKTVTSSERKYEELSVDDEKWKHISKFLLTRKSIEQKLERASFHSGIYKEACSIGRESNSYPHIKKNTLETPTRMKVNQQKTSNTDEPELIGFSDRSSLSPKSSFSKTREKKRKMPPSPSFLSPHTKLQKQRPSLQFIATTSSLTPSSWFLVTKLLNRRKKTSLLQFKEVSQPYFKLSQFVRDKIQELHRIISIMTAIQTDKRHQIASNLYDNYLEETVNEDNAVCDSNIGLLCDSTMHSDSYNQDNIVKMTIKINLWQRLADNLTLVVMHEEF